MSQPVNPFAQPATQQSFVNPFAQAAPQQQPAQPAAQQSAPFAQPAQQQPAAGGMTPEQIASLFANPAKQETDRVRFIEIGFRNDGQPGGRLLLINPKKIEQVPDRDKPGQVKDRMTADIVILDGGPIEGGGQPDQGKPHTWTKEAPLLNRDVWIEQKAIVSQCREAVGHRLAGKGLQLVIGRIGKGQQSKPGYSQPYILLDATDEEKQLAAHWYAQNLDKLQ